MKPCCYKESRNEKEVFRAAYAGRLPLMLTGPTGCGKTRLVEHMAALLERPLFTVSCHDDLTSRRVHPPALPSGRGRTTGSSTRQR